MNAMNQRGQAMLETILFTVLVVLALIAGLRELAAAIGARQDNLETFYALPFP